jgi:hypothetical protein
MIGVADAGRAESDLAAARSCNLATVKPGSPSDASRETLRIEEPLT